MSELINILIRHREGREEMLKRCIESIWDQIYKNYRLIISYEQNPCATLSVLSALPYVKIIQVPAQHYNLHLNSLKSKVENGWFMAADDDDALASPNVLQDLSNIIVNNYPWKGAYIGRFLRNGRPKPPMSHMRQGIIQKGFCGGGCVVLHHSFKDVADWKPMQAADYEWMKELQEKKVPMKFIDLILQKTFNNGLHGR